MTISIIEFTNYFDSIQTALDELAVNERIASENAILIKPNLINASPHPVTTPKECCDAIIRYIRKHSDAEIVIGEGCGDSVAETDEIFDALGYREISDRHNVPLIDLNHQPLVKKTNPNCREFKEMYLPEIAFSHYVISVPVLKAHSIATITGALKNMMGFAPPKYYAGRYGSWKKAVFHGNMQQSITDLCSYIRPDLSIMDATIGLANFHLGGAHCSPPMNKIIAGYDPFVVDRQAATFLGFDWREIGHLRN